MQRKKRCDQCARPSGSSRAKKKPKQQQRVCHMNYGVNEQMGACVHAEELAVDHMRDPRERMPVCRVERGERPSEPRERNTAIHHRIFPDVRGVIERDELMTDHLCINSECNRRQSEQDEEIRSLQSSSVAERGDTSFVPRSNKSSFSLSRSLFGHSSRDYQRSDKRILAVAKRFKAFSCCPEFLGNCMRLQPVSHHLH